MRRFVRGFHAYFNGIRYWLAHRSLVKISVVPLFVDAVIFGGGLYLGWLQGPALIAHWSPMTVGFISGLLHYFVALLVILFLLLLVLLFTLVFANLVAFPFHDRLARKTLELKGLAQIGQESALASFARNLSVALRKAFLFTILSVMLFAAGFIPVLNVAAAFLSLLILVYNFMDYSFDHRHLSLSERFSFFRAHFWEISGFAVGLGLTFAIPVINFVAIPGSIVAAACLFAELAGTRKKHS